jgi:2-oxoglutarate dehydrogenase E1 component
MDKYSYISNAHSAYIDGLYQAYQQNPQSVDVSWQKFFEGFDFHKSFEGENQNGYAPPQTNGKVNPVGVAGSEQFEEIKVRNLIQAYRSRGHLLAKTNPIRERKDRIALLNLDFFRLSEADMDKTFQSGISLFQRPATLREILERAKYIYTNKIGFEYMYIREPDIITWFKSKIENKDITFVPSKQEQDRILSKLNEAVAFENFLHTKYVGKKRFSLEGGETAIPALDTIISASADLGTEEVVIGMAHRGRLNVLANIMGKTYEDIFNEFEETLPKIGEEEMSGDGDVKYHMGYSNQATTINGKTVTLHLMPNPSHLEAVNAVVAGYTRANIDTVYNGNYDKILPILIHGDAAVAGQGIGYELIQMSKLAGYAVGGTIHFVINNQVGFTTDFEDGRSSIYCTDLAKVTDSPVLHVNGDDPEAVIYCCKLAAEFRVKFNRDIFIDMVCYRKHGHNESDEPRFTQPKMYNIIAKHPTPREVYAQILTARGEAGAEMAKQMESDFKQMLQDRLNMVKQKSVPYVIQKFEEEWSKIRFSKPEDFDHSPKTGISQNSIDVVGKALTTIPDNFNVLKQIGKILSDRKRMFFEDKKLDWGAAELLAFGSILNEGKVVRMTGQDVWRGTFSHRHAVLRDAETNETYCPLKNIHEKQGQFNIYNSLLSEYAVLGFEFGYAMADPNALVIWEAQFGDFANGAQIMIDQFISSTESKWAKMNGLVMLLPHGYEGQGPEHSNARPERFLQLAAEYNMIILNLTTAANFFHALRRQLAWEFRKPMVLMSPKSLLKDAKVASPIEDFLEGTSFQEYYTDNYADAKTAKKLIFCTGKVYFDLLKKQQDDQRKDVAIVRIEQLHPFPAKAVHQQIAKYPKAKAYWVQEEPLNMGYWSFIQRVYTYDKIIPIGRKESASPATGYSKLHAKEQEAIINKAFE